MTSTPARGAKSVRGSAGRPLAALSATPALIILLLCGLGLRLAVAYVIFPASGFASDVGTYVSWALTMANHGAAGFYSHVSFIDYPPAYLLILWPIGVLGQQLAPLAGGDASAAVQSLIKLPPIVIDLIVAGVLYRLVRGWAATKGPHRAGRMALIAASLYVLNPVTWYDSALWGQTDAAGALVMLLGVAALIRGNAEGSAAMAVVAAMVKPQYGIVMIPLVFVVLVRRHLFDVGSAPRQRPLVRGRLGAWLLDHQGPVRLVTSFVAAWATFFLIALPFAMGPYEYLKVVFGSVGGYAYLSVNAYNPWALLGAGGTPSLASSGSWSSDTVPFLGPLPGVVIGAALLLLGFLWSLLTVFLRPDRRAILVAAVVLSAAFFVLPTRVHERYLFPAFAFLPILAVFSRRWAWATAAFSVGSLMNLHAILTFSSEQLSYGTPNVQNLLFGELFRTFPLVLLAVVLQAFAFAFALSQSRPWAVDDAQGELAGLSDDEGDWDDARLGTEPVTDGRAVHGPLPHQPASSWQPTRTVGGAAGPAASLTASRPAVRLGSGAGGWTGRPGLASWIDGKLGTLRPVRGDRSSELAREGSGRWDRLDLVVVVVLVVGSFTLRGFNLAQPYDMYFDEVYHARTATEFLQDWRYGIVHSIYEYTHPHLAKYAMALGIQVFADDAVTGTTRLPQTVVDSAIAPRWSPATLPEQRNGDRMYVLDGTQVGAYDLATREQIGVIPVGPECTALTVDEGAHKLYIGCPGGQVSVIDTTQLDSRREAPRSGVAAASSFVTITGTTGTIVQLAVVEGSLIARTSDGWIASIDTAGAGQTGTVKVAGAADLERAPATDQVRVDPAAVTDPVAEAGILAKDLAEDATHLRSVITKAGDTPVGLGGYLSQTEKDALQKDITDGKLAGVTVESGPVVAVSGRAGVTFLDGVGLGQLNVTALTGAAGMALVDHGLDAPTLYVATDAPSGPKLEPVAVRDTGPTVGTALTMPGPIQDVVWNEPANLVHVVGNAPDGSPTIYVVEPHGNAVFADARLGFRPVRVLADTQPDRPQSDRTAFLALSADGTLATVDVGHNAFAWRLPGVAMGSLLIACVYLLARLLFRRRSVGVIAAVLVLAGGMFFANARIAMNDTYVTGFTLAAVTLFTPLYLGIWRRRWQILVGLVGVGLLLGLALASKWVAAYAMGGLALLVLLRSALGRIVALAAMVGMTGVLGALAIRAPEVPQPHINVFFPLLMLALTVALAVAMVRRPVRMTMDELRFAVVAPAVLGVLLVGTALLLGSRLPREGLFSAGRITLAGAGVLALGALAYAIAWACGRFLGRGPLAPPRPVRLDQPVPSPAPSGWLRPGHAGGIPWLFALLCLAAIPLVVYVISYIPWFNIGNQLVEGIPAGHQGGNTLWNLTLQMYDYHNNLRAGHAASSPWWAWPLNLKPVWFYQHGFADSTTGVIYDAENLVLIWLAIPAMAFAAWTAWVRRSLSLTLIVLLFAAMWLPWSRIDRATFQYHVFTSLPFAALALAYFLAELWHGPPPGAWLLARIAAAVAILGAPLLWIGRGPLCLLAGSAAAHAAEGGADGIACGAITRSTTVSEAALASVVILLVGLVVVGWQLWRLFRPGTGTAAPIRLGRVAIPASAGPFVTLLVIVAAVILASRSFSPDAAFTLSVDADELALLGLAALAVPAWLALHARDSRRFVLGVLTAAVLWFVAWYPNLSGLPMPNSIANMYQGLLPSWNYDFWFAVNKDEPAKSSITEPAIAILAITLVILAIAIVTTHLLRPEKPVVEEESVLPESI